MSDSCLLLQALGQKVLAKARAEEEKEQAKKAARDAAKVCCLVTRVNPQLIYIHSAFEARFAFLVSNRA
jgi:hypothetical protein